MDGKRVNSDGDEKPTKIRKQDFVEKPFETNEEKLLEHLTSEYQPQLLNYQLVGDLVSIMIAQAASQKHPSRNSIMSWKQHYCEAQLLSSKLASSLKKKNANFPIAKNIILSIGYDDACLRSNSKQKCIRSINKIIERLRKRGVREIIITNVPPCLKQGESKDHWDYLENLNESIKQLSERSDSILLCDIFSSFCLPKNFFGSQSYIINGIINYEIHPTLYVKGSGRCNLDGIAFSSLGKNILRKKVEETADKRWKCLQTRVLAVKDKVICSITLDCDSKDDDDDKDGDDDDIIIVEPDLKPIVKIEVPDPNLDDKKPDVNFVKKKEENENWIHDFGCNCQKCVNLHAEQIQKLKAALNSNNSV